MWTMKLTTHLHPEPRSGMRGAMPPLPQYALWRGAQLKEHRDKFTFQLHPYQRKEIDKIL
jgi:hypothetical protein